MKQYDESQSPELPASLEEPDHRRGPGVRVLLCDDHELVRRGVATLLESESDMTVVGEAGTADEALIQAVRLEPDVVVMDVRLPGRSGIEACRDIRALRETVRVLMLTSFADDEALLSSVMAGASGFFLKNIRSGELINAIRQVAAGRSLLDPAAEDRVRARLRSDAPLAGRGDEHLTHQETRILALIADGLTNRQIAERLDLSEKTVKNYVSNVLGKLGLSRRAQAAAWVAGRRWSRDDPPLGT